MKPSTSNSPAPAASPFKPAWWLSNRHLQTVWPAFTRRRSATATENERIELPDGDFIDLAWGPAKNTSSPIVLLLHGLEGSVKSHYVGGMMAALSSAGLRSVLMHFRGCSGESNRLARRYHSGETGDVAHIVATLRRREPNIPISAIGFSLGGNVLLKWLGETGASNPLSAAVAVSVPFELMRSVETLQRGLARVYDRYLLQHLLRSTRDKFAKRSPSEVDLTALHKVRTIWDFDESVTAPLHGFCGAQDYYQRSSSRQFLHAVAVPTLIIQALDDPFLPPQSVPDKSEVSPAVTLDVYPKGGHVGFVSGRLPWRPSYHLEQRVPEFLRHYSP